MRTILEWLGRLGLALVFTLFSLGAVLVAADGGWNVVWGVLGFALFGFGGYAFFTTLRWERPRTIAAPSPLPAESRGVSWFEYVDEDVDESQQQRFTAEQHALLDRLRTAASSLPFDGVGSDVDRVDGAIVATVWVTDRAERVLLSVGIHFSPGLMRAGRVHHGHPPELPPLVEATGDDEELVDRAIGWLDTVLRRPVERREWWYLGRPYAARYQFADTGETLLQAFERSRMPWRRHRQLRTTGDVDTSLLGAPDATIAVRANGRTLPTPLLPRLPFHDRV